MVTDARPEHKNDITEANRKKREEAYTLVPSWPRVSTSIRRQDCKGRAARRGRKPGRLVFVKRCAIATTPPPGASSWSASTCPQSRPERLQSATADPIDAGTVRSPPGWRFMRTVGANKRSALRRSSTKNADARQATSAGVFDLKRRNARCAYCALRAPSSHPHDVAR